MYEVDGLKSFKREAKDTEKLKFHGKLIPVLKLERILKSKESIAREIDLAHIVHIRNLLRCRRATRRRRREKIAAELHGRFAFAILSPYCFPA